MNKQQKIPDEWRNVELDSLAIDKGLVRGPFGGAIKKEMFTTSGYKVYEQRNAIYGSDKLGEYYIDENKFNELKRFSVKPGDFIVSCSGTIGRIYQIPQDAPKGVINQALLKITIDKSKINDKFFYYQFSWDKFQSKVVVSTQGGAMQNLVGMDIFRKTNFILPPLSEQNRIVQILETWDKYLKLLYKKINIKKNVKKALLQNLMTGKIRLKGFEDKWNYKKLGDAFVVNPSNHNLPEEFIYIDLGSVDKGVLIKENVIKLKSAPSRAQRLLDKGDVLFQMVRPYQRNNYYFDKNGDYVASTGYAQIRANGSSKFVYYLLHSDKFVNSVITRCTGSNYPAINSSDLSKIRVELPTTKEQAEISNLLTIADKEIETLERQRKIVLNQKKYLLNNLITGQIRVPEFASHN